MTGSCKSTLCCMDMSTKSACLQHNAAAGQEISQRQQPVGFCWCIHQDWVWWMRHKLARATCLMLAGCARNLSRRTSSSIWVAASPANTQLSQVISKCGCGTKPLPVCESLSAAHSCCRRLTIVAQQLSASQQMHLAVLLIPWAHLPCMSCNKKRNMKSVCNQKIVQCTQYMTSALWDQTWESPCEQCSNWQKHSIVHNCI